MDAFASNLVKFDDLPLLDIFYIDFLKESKLNQRWYFYRCRKIKWIKSYHNGEVKFEQKGLENFLKEYWIFWKMYQKWYCNSSNNDKELLKNIDTTFSSIELIFNL